MSPTLLTRLPTTTSKIDNFESILFTDVLISSTQFIFNVKLSILLMRSDIHGGGVCDAGGGGTWKFLAAMGDGKEKVYVDADVI